MKMKKIKHHLCLVKIYIEVKATFLQVIGIDAKTHVVFCSKFKR